MLIAATVGNVARIGANNHDRCCVHPVDTAPGAHRSPRQCPLARVWVIECLFLSPRTVSSPRTSARFDRNRLLTYPLLAEPLTLPIPASDVRRAIG